MTDVVQRLIYLKLGMSLYWTFAFVNNATYVKLPEETERIIDGDIMECHARAKLFGPICLSVEGPLLCLCPNAICQFKDAHREKAELSWTAREGRREAAAFTVNHESLQPTDLDLCHACSLCLSYLLSQSFYLQCARSVPLRQPAN